MCEFWERFKCLYQPQISLTLVTLVWVVVEGMYWKGL